MLEQQLPQVNLAPSKTLSQHFLTHYLNTFIANIIVFVARSLAVTSTGLGVFMVLWFYVRKHPYAQPAVVLVFKATQKTGPGLKVSSNRLGESGIELGTHGYKASDLSDDEFPSLDLPWHFVVFYGICQIFYRFHRKSSNLPWIP